MTGHRRTKQTPSSSVYRRKSLSSIKMDAIRNVTSFMLKVNTELKCKSALLFTNQAEQAGNNFSDLRKHLCLHTKNLFLYMHLPVPSTAKFGESWLFFK